MQKFVVAVAAFLMTFVAWAQPSGTLPDTYRLQQEDLLRLQIFASGTEIQLAVDVPVGPDGNITAPFVGSVRAQGLTVSELAENLRVKYIENLKVREPQIGITILQYRRIQAAIDGAVLRPGQYQMRPGDRLMELLAQGGGVVQDRADLRRVTFRRRQTEEVIPIDLYALLIQGDMSQNYSLMDGDVLTVPADSRNVIFVFGKVQRPGAYPYREPLTVLDAFITAGSEIPGQSKISDIKIIRPSPFAPGGYVTIKVDLIKFLNKGDYSQNIALLPGDIVNVGSTRYLDPAFVNQIANALFILDRAGIRLFRF
ncbi:MAG: polysaccharide biosynthesis/export family protein [Fimbriimonadaceae bacterium]|nr:polysaccharide biosynthesis/export family protein [Fimbriimonadaceae bacterium]